MEAWMTLRRYREVMSLLARSDLRMEGVRLE